MKMVSFARRPNVGLRIQATLPADLDAAALYDAAWADITPARLKALLDEV